MMAFLAALLAFFGWGINDVLAIKLFRQNDPAKITFASGYARLIIWLLFLPFFLKDISKITVIPMIFNLIAGISSALGYYFYGKASKSINPVLVTSISGGWGVTTVILGLLIFSERLDLFQFISSVFVFAGLFLVIFNFKSLKRVNFTNPGIIYALGSFVVWGICGAFIKLPVLEYGWYLSSIIMLVPYVVIISLIEKKEMFRLNNLKINNYKLFIFVVLCIIIGDMGYNSSFSLGGNITMLGAVGGSYAVLSTVLAYFLYKEPLTKQQIAGVILTLLGIIGIAYYSSF